LAHGRRIAVELVTVVDGAAPMAVVSAELGRRAQRYGLLRAEHFVVHGAHPGSELLDHVSGRDGALLVIATTAHGGADEHQLGAVTDDVLRRTRQPVMVVGPRAVLSAGCLVVVVDDAGTADAALPVVERWVETFEDCGVRIVEIQALDAWPRDVDDGRTRDVDRYVDQLGAHGIQAIGEVAPGLDPVLGVIDGVARTDVAMIVVTSPPDIGQPTHWFHTARRLIRFSPRPVLVVPVDRYPPGWQ
jgi:nucleotide-binding universal stress UspA family protein